MRPFYSILRSKILLSSALTLMLGFTATHSSKAIAADTLQLRLGLLQTTVKVNDLEFWLTTGKIPPRLNTYRWFLTPELRQRLQQEVDMDATVAQSFLDQLWKQSEGEQFLQQLTTAFPKSDKETLKNTLTLTLEENNSLNFLSFVKTYPNSRLKVDLSAVAQMTLQLQSASLENKLLQPQLNKLFQDSEINYLPKNLNPSEMGTETVYSQSLRLNDSLRQRIIPIQIYYSQQTKGPLILMSHGFAADRFFAEYLARHLASHGFTVVSIEHPGSNIQALISSTYGMDINEILPSQEFIDRPQDVKFVLDKLARFNATIPYLKDKFNTTEVTLIGHSFGGYTAFALAGATVDFKKLRKVCQQVTPLGRSPADWLQCAAAKLPYRQQNFKDNRIKQIIALNPIVGNIFSDLSQITVPTLILSNTEDGITPTVTHQLQPFQQLGGEKYLLIGKGATHMSVTDISNLNSSVGQSTLVREVMGKEANPLRNGVKGVSLAFIAQLTPEAAQYKPFLSNHYLHTLHNSTISLAFTSSLPNSVQLWMNTLNRGKTQITRQNPSNQPFFIANWWESLRTAHRILPHPEYCTRQVDDMLTTLLRDYS
jgi:predicted dienelactone hydrolase